jgi:enamine deaminase RidA (YjgF/YER057c/UK114 family)
MRQVVVATFIGLIGFGAGVAGQVQRIAGPTELPFSAATRADGLVYVAGMIVADGDIRNQTRRVLENMDAALRKAGSSLVNAASVHVYLKHASDFAAMNEVYRTFWKTDPPVRTTVQADLVTPNGLVEISAVAVPDGGERTVIHPAGWAPALNPYSYGIKTGNTLFLAGLVARNGKDNSPVEGPMAVQTRAVLGNGAEILTAAGMGFEHVVSSRVFITDATMFQEMNGAYRTYFPKDPPARATVVARPMNAANVVEITMTAVNAPKQVFTTPAADGTPGKPNPLLSSAVKVGNRLYVSGILGNTPETRGDVEAQTRELLARVGRTMTAAGYGWSDVVDAVVYMTDVAYFDGMNRGYRSVFAKDFPARATVRTGLVNADALVEIMFVASK